jgi:hypothetical protein
MKVALGALLAVGMTVPAGPSHGSPPLNLLPPTLPSGHALALAFEAQSSTWIVTATPGEVTRRIARHYHAKKTGPPSTAMYKVRRRYLRPMIRRLQRAGTYVNHQPNSSAHGTQAIPPDPLDPTAAWRPMIVDPNLSPPPVTPSSPLLAIVDDPVDLTHPEFVGAATKTLGQITPRSSHGVATAAIAGAPKNDAGIIGVWPGMRVLNVPLTNAQYRCSDRIEAISGAIRAGAAVISLEYGAPQVCFGEYVMVQLATGRGIVVVAGAGNTYAQGNDPEFPASLPHVVTVAAIGADLYRAPFSTANPAVDLSAPGVNVLTAVRPGDAGDAERDGYAAVSGTSFAAPMVAAAAAWVRAARPELGRSEVVSALLRSARDAESPGWDEGTGYGVLDISAALLEQPPHADPLEPNDDILWIDGRVFAKPDQSVGAGGRNQAFIAMADQYEDPVDVYRVVLPPRGRARVTVIPVFGDPDLAAYAPGARSIYDRHGRIARSRRPGKRAERLVLSNREGHAHTFYVAVTPRSLNTAYVLGLKRLQGAVLRPRSGRGRQPAPRG